MNFIEINGTATRYELTGAGDTVIVLIHEMGGLLENWDEVVPALAQDFRVLRYDWRGAGLAEKVVGELTIDMLADDLLALLDALDIDKPVLAGVAVGAAIALHFAGRHPDRVAGLVAMSPAVDMDPAARASRLEMLEGVKRNGMRAIMDGALAAGYPATLREPNPERFRKFQARWLANDPESFVAAYKMLIDMDIAQSIAAIRCPSLGVGGTLDTFRTPQYVEKIMGGIPDVSFVAIETGHHQSAATPELIAEVVRDFAKHRAA